MKKILLTIVIVLAFIIAFLAINTQSQKDTILDMTYDFIETYGYSRDSINNVYIEHSYANKLLGYNEWRISLSFKEVSDFNVWLSYKNNEITYEGVTTNYTMDKGDYIKYSESFKKGSLIKDYSDNDNNNDDVNADYSLDVLSLFTKDFFTATYAEYEILSNAIDSTNWNEEGTADCINNIKFIIDGKTYYYHSECGTINDNENNRSLTLSSADKDIINDLIESHFEIITEEI